MIKQKFRKNDIFWVSNSCFHRDVFILFQIFCNSQKKCLRTTYCLLRGILSFQCALVMNNFVSKRTCDLFWNNIAKTLFHKTKAFIVINVRFENWQISVEAYPRIFSNFLNLFIILFSLVLFDLLMPFDQSYARKNIWWFIIVGILRQLSESGAWFTDRSNHCCAFSINILVPFFKLIMISLSHLECRR